jgi:hypothetical protein
MASLGAPIRRRVNDTVTVRFGLKKAGVFQGGLSASITATVYDEADALFATPAVTEPVTAVYEFSFAPDAAGTWTAKMVESTIPAAESWYFDVTDVVIGDRLPDTLSQANVETWAENGADASLATVLLDQLIANPASPVKPTINSHWDRITSRDGAQDFLRGTDSLQAIREEAPTDTQTGLTAQGYTAARGPNLDNLNATVSSRSSHSEADVDTELTTNHGAGAWQTAVGFSTHSAADAADAVWDEDIVAAHGGADSAGLILSQLTSRTVIFNTAVDDGSILGQMADDGSSTFDRTTDSLQAIADTLPGSGPTAADIADAVWTELLSDHEATAGSAAEALYDLYNTRVPDVLSQANIEVWSETGAMSALQGYRLDQLIFGPASPITPAQNSFWDRITSKDGSQTYLKGTDSLEALRDKINDDVPSAAGIADAVWEEVLATHLGAGKAGQALYDLWQAAIARTFTVAAGSGVGEVRSGVTTTIGNDHYKKAVVIVRDGSTGEAIGRVVSQYFQLNDRFVLSENLPFTPETGVDEVYVLTGWAGKLFELMDIAAGSNLGLGSWLDRAMNKDSGQTFTQATDSLEAQSERGVDILADTAAMQPLVDAPVSGAATEAEVQNAIDTDARLVLLEKFARNKLITDPNTGVMTLYDDNGVDVLLSGQLYEDETTAQPYRALGADRRERLT